MRQIFMESAPRGIKEKGFHKMKTDIPPGKFLWAFPLSIFTLISVPHTRGYKLLNHIVLKYAALSSVKELSMHETTYLLTLLF